MGGRKSQLTRMRYGFSDPNILDVKLSRVIQVKKSQDYIEDEAFPGTLFRLDGRQSAQSLARYVSAIEIASAPSRANPGASTREFQKILSEHEPPTVALVRSIQDASIAAYGMLPGRMGSFSPGEADAELATARSRDVSPAVMRCLFGFNSPVFALSREFYDQILALSYLGPLRSPPERHYIISGADRETVGMRGERMPHLLYRRRREVLPKIDDWFCPIQHPVQHRHQKRGRRPNRRNYYCSLDE